MNRVVLYSRPNCPLCDEARNALTSGDVSFEEVDVSQDPALEGEYGSAVPVVEADGVPIFSGGMNPSELIDLLS